MTRIIVHGLGRLGGAVSELAQQDSGFGVAAAIDCNTGAVLHPGFAVYAGVDDCEEEADVIVDCSTAAAVGTIVSYALAKKIPIVICTTALEEETLRQIDAASAEIPVFLSANMSLGVNLMAGLVKTATKALNGVGFDIEIIERHHSQKIDAPSGTAKLLADSIFEAIGPRPMVYDRSPLLAKRGAGEIGIHSIRGGNITGDHTVLFAGPEEIIEIKHSALSRKVFAQGALAAAKFIAARPAGLYTMDDLINQ